MSNLTLIDLLATRIESALAQAGWDMPVIQKDQPTQEGIPGEDSPTAMKSSAVFFEITADNPYGWAHASYLDGTTEGTLTAKETTQHELMVQISAQVKQDVSNTSMPTALDVLTFVRGFLAHRSSVQYFKAAAGEHVGILRVSAIRNGYFIQDTDQFEAHPSFDFVMTHPQSVSVQVELAKRATVRIDRV